MVEAQNYGSFCPRGRENIFTAAIGTSEHPGRVRTVGRGVGLMKVFGCQRSQYSKEKEREAMKEEIFKEVSQKLESQFQSQFQAQFLSQFKELKEFKAQMLAANTFQQNKPSSGDTVRISTKGSYSPGTDKDEPKTEQDILRRLGCMAFDLPVSSVLILLDYDLELSGFYIFARNLTNMTHDDDLLCANQHLQLWSV